MASTDVEVCNIALGRVRGGEIGALDEQSTEAETCIKYYDPARQSVLSSYPWTFAKKTQALSLYSYELAEWQYCYAYPNDCLMAIYVVPPSANAPASLSGVFYSDVEYDPIQFEVLIVEDSSGNDVKVIGSNYTEATLAYVKDVEDVRLFSAKFVDMLGWRLGADLAVVSGGDQGLKYADRAEAKYEQLLERAVIQDLNQNKPRNSRQQMPREIKARSGNISQYWSYNSLFYRR